MLRSLKSLFKYTIQATDGDIGEVYDFYFDDYDWVIRYLVADVDAIGRQVLISPVAVKEPDWENQVLPLTLTKHELKFGPDTDFAQPISRQQEIKLHQHYGWPMYWLTSTLPDLRAIGLHPHTLVRTLTGKEVEPEEYYRSLEVTLRDMTEVQAHTKPIEIEPTPTEVYQGNPRLRSAKEVIGYHIQARDGEIGHVEDFIIGDNDWTFQLLVVDTRNWLPGNKVLLAPAWIEKIIWAEAKVYIELSQDVIKNCPEYKGLPNT
jgi:hypothetical protein